MREPLCLIGVRGAFRSGKDTVARFIMEHMAWIGKLNIQQRAFATNLREAVALIFGFDRDYVYTDEFKTDILPFKLLEQIAGDEWERCFELREGATGRDLLQSFGTNICRAMSPDCWASGPITWFKQKGADIGVMADLRFPNEVDVIRNSGILNFIIKVERPGFKGDGHPSERALDDYDGDDFIIQNTSTLDVLKHESERIAKVILERIQRETLPSV